MNYLSKQPERVKNSKQFCFAFYRGISIFFLVNVTTVALIFLFIELTKHQLRYDVKYKKLLKFDWKPYKHFLQEYVSFASR